MSNQFDKKHLIAIDSDGCVFDGMNIKHRRAFIPEAIAVFGLDILSAKTYSKVAEEVNLFSKMRGINRFEALYICLLETKALVGRDSGIPDLEPLGQFVQQSSSLSNDTLLDYIKEHPSVVLDKALEWSHRTNETVAKIASEIPVFEGVVSALEEASCKANLMVCSAASRVNLEHEWGAASLTQYVSFVAGQEFGPKAKQINKIVQMADFPTSNVLMVGDALGDLQAAQLAGVRFYPIIPGKEALSWRIFHDVVLPAFVGGAYSLEDEQGFVSKLEQTLSEPSFECLGPADPVGSVGKRP